ncbi:MAG: hypothetical protein U0K86_06810 [Agathobacter sp.]|nr:hypothetical protein [Agathobacter sp.]
MKKISDDLARQIKAGGTHYHWLCFDKKIYVSKPYYSVTKVAVQADKHSKKYKSHKKKVLVYSCDKICEE